MTRDPPGDELRRRADRIFTEALDVPEGERAAFVARRCGRDPTLAAEVAALLAASRESASSFLTELDEVVGRVRERHEEARAAAAGGEDAGGASDPDPATDRLIGERVGPYRMEARIARGGMGTVYRARRIDGRYEREVALKVLRRGLDTEDIVRRFRHERRILAALTHPGIASLFGAGETDDGRPYLAMELVSGRPILEHCDRVAADLDARLDLLGRVCDAVEHAHRHLVVHRDLKSSNILVTEDGSVKLLDFGIAKLLDPEAHAGGPRTRTGARLLTPACASPEQLAGEPVTTASDVYQLGVLLYELLCGRSPHSDATGDLPRGRALERRVVEDDPLPPSARIGETTGPSAPAAREMPKPRIPADLDAIALKALRTRPTDRYASVAALREDIERYRNGLPVDAVAGSRRYRMGKFLRRHRRAAAAAAIVVAGFAGWAVTATLMAGALAEERDRVREEAARTAAIRDFLVSMFEAPDPYGARPVSADSITARELLDAGVHRLATEMAEQPGERAALAHSIGRTYGALGADAQGRALLEEALDIHLARDGPGSPAVAADLLELGSLHRSANPDSARVLLERALVAAESAWGVADPRTAEALTTLGEHLFHTSNPDPARSGQLLDSAVTILRATPSPPPEQLADALTVSTYGRTDEMGLVIDRMTEALEIRRDLYGPQHPAVAGSLNDLSLALEAAGEPARADSLMEEALRVYRATLGPEHPTTLIVMSNLAGHRRDRGEYDRAETLYRDVIDLRETYRPDDRIDLAYPLYGLGATLVRANRPRDALVPLQRTHDILAAELGWGHTLAFTTRTTLAEALRRVGRLTEAAALLEASHAGFDDAPWLDDGGRLETLRELSSVYEAQGRSADRAAVEAEISALEGSSTSATPR